MPNDSPAMAKSMTQTSRTASAAPHAIAIPTQGLSWGLLFLLSTLIIYGVYQSHYNINIGIPGVNPLNLVFLLAWGATLALPSEREVKIPLRGSFFLLFATMVWGLLIGEMQDTSQVGNDFIALKDDIFYPLYYFLFFRAVRGMRGIRMIFAVLLCTGFLVAVEGVRQALDYGLFHYKESARVSGPFGASSASNIASAYYASILPLFVSVAIFRKSHPWQRIFAVGCSFLVIFATFYTYSRQAYFIEALVLLLMVMRRHKILAIILVSVISLTYQLWLPDTVLQRIDMTEQVNSSGAVTLDASTESRLVIWAGAMHMLADHPLGVGLNHFHRLLHQYLPELPVADAHNFYVLFTTETGPLGLLVLVLLVVNLLRMARNVEKIGNGEISSILGQGFTASTIAIILSNLYGSRLLNGDMMLSYWVFAAICARYLVLARQPAEATPERGVNAYSRPMAPQGRT